MRSNVFSLLTVLSIALALLAASCIVPNEQRDYLPAPTIAPSASPSTLTPPTPQSLTTPTPQHPTVPAIATMHCPPVDAQDFPEWALPTASIRPMEATHPEQLLGLIYTDLPDGVILHSATMVMEEAQISTPSPGLPHYWFLHVRYAGADALWLTRQVCSTGSGSEQVVDMLNVFPLPRTQVFFSFGCSLRGREDPEIVAILAAKHPIPSPFSNINPIGSSSDVIRAWRASRDLGRFEEIPTDGLSCAIIGEGRSFHWDEP